MYYDTLLKVDFHSKRQDNVSPLFC